MNSIQEDFNQLIKPPNPLTLIEDEPGKETKSRFGTTSRLGHTQKANLDLN